MCGREAVLAAAEALAAELAAHVGASRLVADVAEFLLPPLHSWAPALRTQSDTERPPPAQLPGTQAQAGGERPGQLPGGVMQAGSAPEARAGVRWGRTEAAGGAVVVGDVLRRRGGGEPAGGGAEDSEGAARVEPVGGSAEDRAGTGGGEPAGGGAVAGPALRRRGGGELAGAAMADSAGGEDWGAQAGAHPSPARSEMSAWSERSEVEGYQPVLLAGGERLSKVSAPVALFADLGWPAKVLATIEVPWGALHAPLLSRGEAKMLSNCL